MKEGFTANWATLIAGWQASTCGGRRKTTLEINQPLAHGELEGAQIRGLLGQRRTGEGGSLELTAHPKK